MSVHLSAITSVGGLPLFNRIFDSTGRQEKIAFVNISTLNAINLFCNVNQGKLYSAETEHCKIYWKNIDSITLILILNSQSSTATKVRFTDDSLENLLNLIYKLMLMFCTKNELINEHLEKVKLRMKNCYFAIDYIIECFFCKTNLTVQTNCIEYKLGSYKCVQLSDDLVNNLSAEVDSSFVCLYVDSKFVHSTANYSEKLLTTIDGQLIDLLLQAKSAKESDEEDIFEIEIYLPHSCPEAISRLISCKLSKRCSVTMLCGDKPTLDYIGQDLIERLRRHPQNLHLFNELETKAFIQSEHLVDDRVINFVYLNFEFKFYFKNGLFCREKITSLLNWMQIFDMDEDREQVVVYANYKLFAIYRKTDAHLVLIMFPRSMDLNEIKKSGFKTYNEILKIKKKNFSLNIVK